MQSYAQFCPIAKAAEIIGEKWSLVILRELVVGTDTFSSLRNYIPLISPTLLSRRLIEFEDAGVIQKLETGLAKPKFRYVLTEAGKELAPILMQIGEWGNKWAVSRLNPKDYDPRLFLWDIKRNIDLDVFKDYERYVVEFWCDGVPLPLRKWWFVIEPDCTPDVCHKYPGYEVNLKVHSDIKTYVDSWMGWISLKKALNSKKLSLEGSRQDIQLFNRWYLLNPFARGNF